MACVVEGCESHYRRKENSALGLSFHKFPKDENLQKEWVRRIGRKNYIPKTWEKLCSKHFNPNSFLPTQQEKGRHLKPDAVPMFIEPQSVSCHLNEPGIYTQCDRPTKRQRTHHSDSSLTKLIQNSDVPMPCTCSNTRTYELSINDDGLIKSYQKRIKSLEKKLERVKMVSKRRLVRINTLTKRISRITKNHDDSHDD